MLHVKNGSLLRLVVLVLAVSAVSTKKVVPIPIQKRAPTKTIFKRSFISAPIDNYLTLGEYFATVSIGTPPQTLELNVNTASADTWFYGPSACKTQFSGTACEGGTYDSSRSSTYTLVAQDAFVLQYASGHEVVGDYIEDSFGISGMIVQNLTMAVVTSANLTNTHTGILGLSLDSNEKVVKDGSTSYPNLPDVLVSQGKINSRSYSLYLNNIASESGTILFGGYDDAKFDGDLIMLPLLPDASTGVVTDFLVAFTSFGITNVNGTFLLDSADFPDAAKLDSTTTLTYLPPDLFDVVATTLDAVSDDTLGYVVDCDIKAISGTLDFRFGSSSGPLIPVPFGELAVPVYDLAGQREVGSNGQYLCQCGIQPTQPGTSAVLGQTFLRSAYILYDLDGLALGMAPTIFNDSSTNIVEYAAGSSNTRVISDTSGPKVTASPMINGSITSTLSTSVAVTRSYPSSVPYPVNEAASLMPITSSAASLTTSAESKVTSRTSSTSGTVARVSPNSTTSASNGRPINTGEDIGLGVGLGIGALVALTIGFFLIRRRRRRTKEVTGIYPTRDMQMRSELMAGEDIVNYSRPAEVETIERSVELDHRRGPYELH